MRHLPNLSFAIVFSSVVVVTAVIDVALGLGGRFHLEYTDFVLDLAAGALLGLLSRAVVSGAQRKRPESKPLGFAITLAIVVGGIALVLLVQGGEASSMIGLGGR